MRPQRRAKMAMRFMAVCFYTRQARGYVKPNTITNAVYKTEPQPKKSDCPKADSDSSRHGSSNAMLCVAGQLNALCFEFLRYIPGRTPILPYISSGAVLMVNGM